MGEYSNHFLNNKVIEYTDGVSQNRVFHFWMSCGVEVEHVVNISFRAGYMGLADGEIIYGDGLYGGIRYALRKGPELVTIGDCLPIKRGDWIEVRDSKDAM